MSDLTGFLLARIAEDEDVARAAAPGPWRWDDPDAFADSILSGEGDAVKYVITTDSRCYGPDDATAAHIMGWAPHRVLAECEAKRRIIEFHESWPVLVHTEPKIEPSDLQSLSLRMTQEMVWLTTREYVARFGTAPPTDPILRALALPYAAHPDYREEWRP